jgi:hypothetical protein
MDSGKRALAGALTVVAGLMLIGCEDTPVTPGDGWTIDVVAQPSVVTIDPDSGEATSTLIATVANDTGIPQSGVSVIFSNAGGTLSSGASGVETDGAGRATTTLTVGESDPDSIVVTVSSGALTDTVTVTKSTAAVNHPPTAVIHATPASEQAVGQTVVFDGTSSTDPDDGDIITMYRWRITSTNPDTGVGNPRTLEGPGLASVGIPSSGVPAFTNVQDLTVELSVTDDPTAPTKFALGRPFSYRASTTIPYKIVGASCSSNAKPVAVIAGPETQVRNANGAPTVSIILDGSLSTDAEGPIAAYIWTCGNGAAPVNSTDPTTTCTYSAGTIARSFTASLQVKDQGINGGQCVQLSTIDTVTITVNP